MIWFGKSFIKFCRSFINLIKLVSTRISSSARVRLEHIENMKAESPISCMPVYEESEAAWQGYSKP